MRKIDSAWITELVKDLTIKANISLRKDVLEGLKLAKDLETNKQARNILSTLIENASIAKKEKLAICQDTGLALVFVEIGQDARVVCGDLNGAINRGIALGYKKGYLRNSVIKDPLTRANKPGYLPGIIHADIVRGGRLRITVLAKGFGCENKSEVEMFKPTVTLDEIKGFIIEVVKQAGADACPPFIVGVGIGGTQDFACFLAKKALLKPINRKNPDKSLAALEKDLLRKINRLNIGPMGLGGKTTALGVNIISYPTHIAGLPIAVNISCHALRSATTAI